MEWATESPPPPYNFEALPVVASRSPLWDDPEQRAVVSGLPPERREILVTHPLDAEPSHREEIPGPSLTPFVLSAVMGTGLIGSVFSLWWIPIGAILSIPPAVAWYFTEEKP